MSCRAYFTYHLVQKRYRCVPVEKIRYHNGRELVDSSTILKQGKEGLGRVYVRYANGMESWTNLNESASWEVEVDGKTWQLPPFGWYQRRKEEWGEFRNYSVLQAGEGRRSRVEDKDTILVMASGRLSKWEDVETDGTVILQREETGGYRVINLDAMTLRVKAERLGFPGSAKQAVMHSYDLDGSSVKDGTVAIEQGWMDFSFLAQEQFARVIP